MLGLCEIGLDTEGNPLGLERKRLRKRGETNEEKKGQRDRMHHIIGFIDAIWLMKWEK